MNEIKIFENAEFGNVRTIEIDGKPYFGATDVAKALGYKEPAKAIRTHCKGVSEMDTPTNGGIQRVKFIPEGDIYRLIIRSKLPSAERFEHWVFDEVIPSIRKNGGYIANQENLTDAELLAKAVLVAQKTIEERDKRIKNLESDVDRMKPKEIFTDAVTASETSILVRDLAKLIRQNGKEVGEKRLYKWMRDGGFILKNSTQPTQRAMEMGLFEIVERTIKRANSPIVVVSTTKVTGKGQVYFINKFLKDNAA